ncbi:MAG: pyridoxal-phosphate dependent enzyme, partial [Dehalococcoidia bacterium]|nr:pyridoxal-phosphate dependent enzyme [Dehalococcoidia bacterium]
MPAEPDLVSLAAITAARAALAPDIRLTPVWPFTVPAPRLDVPLLLKCENLQLTGSFKVRGALNFVRQLDAADAARGLIAMSAGNHAQGVALAGAARGIPVTVVMPESAPLAKVNATRALGARVVIHGASLDDARAEAQSIATREGRIFVPPFDDDAVITGQGTLGLELLDQVSDVAEVLVPAGGGGLLAGVAMAIKSRRPDVRVVGVQSAAMDGLRRSFAAGRVVTTSPARTIADGVAVAGPSERTFALIQRHVDEVIAVPDDAIAHAIVL